MSDMLRNWIIGIAGAAMVTAAAMTVTPEGRVKKVVSLVCGLVTLIALLRPITGWNGADLVGIFDGYKQDAAGFSADIRDADENLTRRIIAEKCEAYILDKGESLGITDLEVSVTTAWNEGGFWYPDGAVLRTSAEYSKRAKLSRSIEAELGIPPEELIWRMRDEN